MEKDFMRSDSLVEVEFLLNTNIGIHYHSNIELLYLFNGELTVTVDKESFTLYSGDFLIINANRRHSYEGKGEALIGRFMISYRKTKELLNQNTVLFWCNSAIEKGETYDELRQVMKEIFIQTIENPEENQISLNSLYYKMLHILTSNYLLTTKDIRYVDEKSQADDRLQEVFQYIEQNYKKNISLQEIAEQLYLSPKYISKYIKKKCDINFMELINSVRLGHAMEDILYSEASIMKIAMDNGFASVAAFHKVFKETYQISPSEYRKNLRVGHKSERKEQEDADQHLIHKKVKAYLEDRQVLKRQDSEKNRIYVDVNTKAVVSRSWNNGCNRMINVGTAQDLTKSAIQEQVLYIKEKLGIKYVRFWDIYSPDLYIDIHALRSTIHFGRLDEVIDFLVKNKLRPYIELGFKPLRLLKTTTQNALVEISRGQEFDSDEQMRGFFEEMLIHMIKRYGAEEVQTWYFEYWKKEDLVFSDTEYQLMPMPMEAHREYFRKFELLAGTFRAVLPEVKVGGGGFSMQHLSRQEFFHILTSWKEYEELPDFITLYGYPYQMGSRGKMSNEKISRNMDFIRDNIKKAKEILRKSEFTAAELHVSEYSMTLSNRNVINDHCCKAAFLMQNTIACMEEVDMLGYWIATDIYADYQDSQTFLFGGCGLLTKSGVPKPSFYTFEFLHRLHRNILSAEKNFIVTCNNRGSFRMVCHNFKNLNRKYFFIEENEIREQDIPRLLENREELVICVRLESIENGSYLIKQHQVSQKYGSVQDEWIRLDMNTDLSMEEQEYLGRISTPRLSTKRIKVDKNVLEFNIRLEPNEIQYINITFK